MKVKRYGIADCYGIESYLKFRGGRKAQKLEQALKVPERSSMELMSVLKIRAMANRQRHAVFYIAILTKEQDDIINRLIKAKDAVMALKYLKSTGQFSVPPGMVHSAELIPNPDLDPWGKAKSKTTEVRAKITLDEFEIM